MNELPVNTGTTTGWRRLGNANSVVRIASLKRQEKIRNNNAVICLLAIK